jgi:N-acetyl-anhydromuramyl-L-alanine amidase AmpD
MRKIGRIIIHHTATSKQTTVESIRNYHVNVRGWRDIGYHYLIDGDGNLRLGRPVWIQGAHCKGLNVDSIGIALIGDFRPVYGNGDLTDGQRSGLYALLGDLCRLYPGVRIHGHGEIARTSCPGNYVQEVINDWRV